MVLPCLCIFQTEIILLKGYLRTKTCRYYVKLAFGSARTWKKEDSFLLVHSRTLLYIMRDSCR